MPKRYGMITRMKLSFSITSTCNFSTQNTQSQLTQGPLTGTRHLFSYMHSTPNLCLPTLRVSKLYWIGVFCLNPLLKRVRDNIDNHGFWASDLIWLTHHRILDGNIVEIYDLFCYCIYALD